MDFCIEQVMNNGCNYSDWKRSEKDAYSIQHKAIAYLGEMNKNNSHLINLYILIQC